MNMIFCAVKCQNCTALLLRLTFDIAVQASLDVWRNERQAIPRRPDQVQVERQLVASH
jgi:hypothetical protein